MQKDLKARVDWIDAAKGFCILLVVFHHVIVTSYSLPTFVSDSGSDIFSYFNRCGIITSKYLQHHDCDWTDELDGNM